MPLTADTAREILAARALTAGAVGRVGLELEAHLVDLRQPARRVSFDDTTAMIADLPELPGCSLITLEPGGQIELSSPPVAGVTAAVDLLRRDRAVVAAGLAERGWGLATVGTDPARAPQRINPAPRYAAMQEHFAATGRGVPGSAMMCSTASLQLNLDAGPAAGWRDRVGLAHQLGPVLVAVSACSPLLAGRTTGWRSTRQQIWGALDERRCGAPPGLADPAAAWVEFALGAPVMLVRSRHDPGVLAPVRSDVSFGAWIDGRALLDDRRPTPKDLDYHLTTLFPPVRMRGFLEVRYLDAVPDRWWPVLAVLVATLLDDPRAADAAADATERVAGAWTRAARDGLTDPELQRVAQRCCEIAVGAAPALTPAAQAGQTRPAELAELADLVASGRCPGDEITERARDVDPLRILQEYAGV